MPMRRLSVYLFLTLLIGLGGWHWSHQAHSQPASTPTPTVPKVRQVSALARLEPADKVIKLQVAAARQSDRVLQWYAKEGERVSAGQLLVRLDGADRLQREVEVAQARVRQMESKLAQVLAGSKAGELERQRGEILRLESELARQKQLRHDEVRRLTTEELLHRRNYERFRQLYQQGACSALEVEQRQLTWNAAQRLLEQAQGELRRSQDTLQAQLVSARGEFSRIAEVRPSDVAAAEADVIQAQSEVHRAQAHLRECRILSPQSGTILRIHSRAGERIASSGLAELAETSAMVAIAEVYQNDLGRLRLQQPCRLLTPALNKPLTGKVVRLGQQVQRQNIFSEQPGEQFDQRVVEVRIALDGPSSLLAANWTHLQVQALFEGPPE